MTANVTPIFQQQGPASRCIIDGRHLGWLSCTTYGFAMLIDMATVGLKRPSGCTVRRAIVPKDVVGGTSIPQNAEATERVWGVRVVKRVGSNVCTPEWAAGKLRLGRPIGLQGNAGAWVGTKHRSTYGNVNHFIVGVRGRGWHKGPRGYVEPSEVLIGDPAADGTLTFWGRKPKGFQWVKWNLVLKFAAALRPWGDNDSRVLGPGKWYAAIFPKTLPHVHLRFGARRTSPFPDRTRITRRLKARSEPRVIEGVNHNRVGKRREPGQLFTAYQVTDTGQTVNGSRRWYGSHNGKRWIHASDLRNKGGAQ